MKTEKLTGVCCLAVAVFLVWSQAMALAGTVDECYGDGQMSVYLCNHTMTSDAAYVDLTIGAGCVFDTHGYTLYVRGTLTNYGTITDSFSGGAGGAGGDGGDGGHGYLPHDSPTPGDDGGDGEESTVHPGKAGCGGPGAGGGGGGGGAWDSSYPTQGDVAGGNGGDGGDGGKGGGYVRIYAYSLDNQGNIHADGQDAPPRGAPDGPHNGSQGAFNEYGPALLKRDASGGGGGGGGGGDGGDGGTVEIYYANLINLGLIHANGGACALGGDEGGSQCGSLDYPARLGQNAEYGAAGGAPGWDPCPPPGEDGCGWGGDGGESDATDYCGTTAHGDPGQPPTCYAHCNGDDGVVIQVQDCNCNNEDDSDDITTGVSEDCQPNGVPDECDIESGTSDDCNLNLVPDECELPGDPDCNENEILDYCDLIFTVESTQLTPIGNGAPQDYTIYSPPEAVSDVTLTFRAVADLDSTNEFIYVFVNDWHACSVFVDDANQCPALRDVEICSILAEDWNTAVDGGNAIIDMIATGEVNPNYCDPPSWIAVSVTYTTDENDCNLNLVPDECESEYTDIGLFISQLLADIQDPILVCMYDQNSDVTLNGDDIQGFVNRLLSLP